MKALYNEWDRKAAGWLRELARAGHISDGVVDERSITELSADDVRGYERVHLFAGIGGWDYALRLAGWPEGVPVWTGSCPCQPFSCAGKGLGTADERHLWPEMLRLVAECRPSVVFGEQVSSKAVREWFAGVRTDLEALGYAVAGADLCAAGVGAPHIRQRLYWVAYTEDHGCAQYWHESRQRTTRGSICTSELQGDTCGLDHTDCEGRAEGQPASSIVGYGRAVVTAGSSVRLGHTESAGLEECERLCGGKKTLSGSKHNGAWDEYRILEFRDGKTRRIGTGVEPLVDGLPGRVGLLRGYGNAIVPQVAAEFIGAFLDVVEVAV